MGQERCVEVGTMNMKWNKERVETERNNFVNKTKNYKIGKKVNETFIHNKFESLLLFVHANHAKFHSRLH